MSGPALARLLRWRLAWAALAANLSGALVVTVGLFAFFFADDSGGEALHFDPATALVAAYLALSARLAANRSARRTKAIWAWLSEERPPDPGERDLVLREPLRAAVTAAVIWAGAALLLGVVEAAEQSLHTALDVALNVALGGVTTCALTFLVAERVLRPATARALSARPPDGPLGPGVTGRLMFVWLLASGVPLLALGLLAAGALWLGEFTRVQTAAAALALSVITLVAGLVATYIAAGALGHSIAAVRHAVGRVRAGDLDTRVEIDDTSEVGVLQAGFNEMAAGLGERERMRDLFGRHVGEEVARAALEQGTALGGEVREIAALFVDIEGSTALAASRPPQEVVALLNSFFAVVVDVVAAHGGWVNKFEGDAALCVFGAPERRPGHADRALESARCLNERLKGEVPEIRCGIGVSAGTAVAGNVGAERRYEYTVIGDPINEAARLSDLAKRRPEGALVAARILADASPAEAARWRVAESTVLRGRPAATGLAVPSEAP